MQTHMKRKTYLKDRQDVEKAAKEQGHSKRNNKMSFRSIVNVSKFVQRNGSIRSLNRPISSVTKKPNQNKDLLAEYAKAKKELENYQVAERLKEINQRNSKEFLKDAWTVTKFIAVPIIGYLTYSEFDNQNEKYLSNWRYILKSESAMIDVSRRLDVLEQKLK